MIAILALSYISRAQAQAVDPFLRAGRNAAVGDFDADGLSDLVYGDPGAGSVAGCGSGYGSVTVQYGDDLVNDQVLVAGGVITGPAVCGSELGYAVTTGDFDNDGFDDLAIGVPGSSVGQVKVLYGGRAGLGSARQQSFSSIAADGTYARFGHALASGDFDCDGDSDVAVGLPDGVVGTVSRAGRVGLLLGSSLRLTNPNTRYSQGTSLGDTAETNDGFGSTLAAGNFNADVRSGHECWDLAIGVPYENVGSTVDAGTAHLLNGSGSGLASAPLALSGTLTNDARSTGLQAGDVNGDGIDDLAMTRTIAGTIEVFHGGTAGIGSGTSASGTIVLESPCGAAGTVIVMSEIVIVGDDGDCDPCCGSGSCCIGGSC